METRKVIVLILSYNGKHLLEDCISSYLRNDYINFKVAVIDNGSTDNTKKWVESNYPDVIVLRTEKNLGYSGGFNLGLKYAFEEKKSDFVLITNNDVLADKKVLSELVKVAETDEKIGFVTGKVYFYNEPDILQTVGKKEDSVIWNGDHIGNKEKDIGQYDKVAERFFADDIFTLVSSRLYNDIGGYNTTFFLQCEEYDWQARCKNKGYKIFYTPYAKIWHKESMTIGKVSPLKAYYNMRNPMIVIMLHKSPEYFRRYIRKHFTIHLLRGSLSEILKRGEFIKAFRMWQGFFSGIIWGFNFKKLSLRHFI